MSVFPVRLWRVDLGPSSYEEVMYCTGDLNDGSHTNEKSFALFCFLWLFFMMVDGGEDWVKCEVERNMNSKSSVKYWTFIEMDVCILYSFVFT